MADFDGKFLNASMLTSLIGKKNNCISLSPLILVQRFDFLLIAPSYIFHFDFCSRNCKNSFCESARHLSMFKASETIFVESVWKILP